jgi:hypothetical protein
MPPWKLMPWELLKNLGADAQADSCEAVFSHEDYQDIQCLRILRFLQMCTNALTEEKFEYEFLKNTSVQHMSIIVFLNLCCYALNEKEFGYSEKLCDEECLI